MGISWWQNGGMNWEQWGKQCKVIPNPSRILKCQWQTMLNWSVFSSVEKSQHRMTERGREEKKRTSWSIYCLLGPQFGFSSFDSTRTVSPPDNCMEYSHNQGLSQAAMRPSYLNFVYLIRTSSSELVKCWIWPSFTYWTWILHYSMH